MSSFLKKSFLKFIRLRFKGATPYLATISIKEGSPNAKCYSINKIADGLTKLLVSKKIDHVIITNYQKKCVLMESIISSLLEKNIKTILLISAEQIMPCCYPNLLIIEIPIEYTKQKIDEYFRENKSNWYDPNRPRTIISFSEQSVAGNYVLKYYCDGFITTETDRSFHKVDQSFIEPSAHPSFFLANQNKNICQVPILKIQVKAPYWISKEINNHTNQVVNEFAKNTLLLSEGNIDGWYIWNKFLFGEAF